MRKPNSRPKWILLFLMIMPVLILLWLEAGVQASRTEHVIAESTLVVLLYGIVAVWLKANEFAIRSEDQAEREQDGQKSPASSKIEFGEGKSASEKENK